MIVIMNQQQQHVGGQNATSSHATQQHQQNHPYMVQGRSLKLKSLSLKPQPLPAGNMQQQQQQQMKKKKNDWLIEDAKLNKK